jgi:hypothetical protein
MSDSFYCIYTGENFPETDRSEEHIVPYAIGGSNQFTTIDVSKKANNDAGSQIDSILINSWFISNDKMAVAT